MQCNQILNIYHDNSLSQIDLSDFSGTGSLVRDDNNRFSISPGDEGEKIVSLEAQNPGCLIKSLDGAGFICGGKSWSEKILEADDIIYLDKIFILVSEKSFKHDIYTKLDLTDVTSISLGKHEENQIVFKNKYVSGRHAMMTKNRLGNFKISDLNSKNGVYVNGKKVNEYILQNGDVINIVSYRLIYSQDYLSVSCYSTEVFCKLKIYKEPTSKTMPLMDF